MAQSFLARLGLWLLVPPGLSIFLSFFGLVYLIAGLHVDPAPFLEGDAGATVRPILMPAMMAGTIVQHVGPGMVLWSLLISKCRAPWLYGWMQFATVLMVFGSPGGIVLAMVVNYYLYRHKVEFNREYGADPPFPPAGFPQPARAIRSLEAENARLKDIVTGQVLDIQRLKSARSENP